METKTCFIISPIGDPDSETRKRSDGLKQLIIEDSLVGFDFDKPQRADDFVNPNAITSDIISSIQNADLCMVDLTDSNPNVMYEFGRRQETGKPYILLAQTGAKLPFDLSVFRTIFYDLSDPFNVKQCRDRIREYISNLLKDGFQRKSSGESLSSIAEQLQRIERRIDSLTPSTGVSINPQAMIDDDELTPQQQFRLALQEKNIPAAESLLPYFERTKQKDVFYDQYLEVLARFGSNIALNQLLNDINYIDSLPNEKRKVEAISYISIGIQQAGRQEEGLKLLSPIIDNCLNTFEDNSNKATVLNQKARLVTDVEERITILKDVIKLNPNDPAFYYNLSVCYENLDQLGPAKDNIDLCMSKQRNNDEESYDSDHVMQAIDIYAKLKDQDTVNKYLNILRSINQNLYRLKKQEIKRYFK